jgi:hypothetical protein
VFVDAGWLAQAGSIAFLQLAISKTGIKGRFTTRHQQHAGCRRMADKTTPARVDGRSCRTIMKPASQFD